jgi:preprotein translocase subunit SecD
MNHRAGMTGLSVAFLFASATLAATAAPAADDAQQVDRIRATMAANAEKAVEKQGGCRILFKVDGGALREAMVTELRDDLYGILRADRIPFAGLAVHDGGVEVRIADAGNRQRVLSKVAPPAEAASPRASAVDIADHGDGLIRLAPAEAGFAERLRGLVRQSMEMIEQGLRNRQLAPAGVQPDGADRIRVVLPGVTTPEPVAAQLGRKARIAFRLVDVSMTAAEAQQGAPPPASEILTDFKTKAPHLLRKEIALDGDDIIDAAPGFGPGGEEPIVSFRFNARGARHFASLTEANVGRPFAIVIDDQVVSVAVIREPIRGGSGQIAGNFTLEDANSIAMRLRSGTLPGRLSVVDQQVVAPAAKP